MQLFKEWCISMKNRVGFMTPIEKFESVILKMDNPGYSSLYAFDEAAASKIREQGHSGGFDRFDTYSDHLLIDIDEGVEGLEKAEARLSGYAYEVWTSGGKGFHLILPHDPIMDKRLPFSHQKIVEKLGVVSDPIYNASRLISLPGRVHPSTKKRKSFLRAVEGRRLEVQLEDKPKIEFKFKETEGDLFAALMRMADLTKYSPYVGTRHLTLFGVALDLKKSGVSFEGAVEMCHLVNNTWKQPKSREEVLAAVRGAYSYERVNYA